MIKSIRFPMSLLIPALTFALVTASPTPAMAEATAGKPSVKTHLDNDKVRVVEVRYKPGDAAKSRPARDRVTHVLSGGTFLRTYADGKTEQIELKTGEVRFAPGSNHSYGVKNIGKSDIVMYVVQLK